MTDWSLLHLVSVNPSLPWRMNWGDDNDDNNNNNNNKREGICSVDLFVAPGNLTKPEIRTCKQVRACSVLIDYPPLSLGHCLSPIDEEDNISHTQ